MKKHFFLKVIVFLVVLSVTFFILNKPPGFLEKTALSVSDTKFDIRSALGMSKPADKKFVIVEVDEKSVNNLGRWPWDRDVIADLIEKLRLSSIVSLDIVFSEKSQKTKDNYLANSIAENGNVIGGFFFRSESTEKMDNYITDYMYDQAIFRINLKSDTTDVKEFPYVEANIPLITESLLANAFFTIEPDIDGIYREYPLAYLFKGMLVPSMAAQTLRYHLNKDIEVTLNEDGIRRFNIGDIRVKNENYIKLNYYDNAEFVSASDVLSGEVSPNFFKDKITLVGVTEIGIYDLRPTPVDSVSPGVLLHLTAMSNLLNDEYLKEPKWLTITMILAITFLIFVISFIKKMLIRVASYIIIIISFYFFSNFMFIENNLWISDFYYIAAAFLLTVMLELIAFFIVDKRSLEMKKAFSTYVSPDIVKIMMQSPEQLSLGGQEREVTVMFTDIRGFTSISENLTSDKLVSILNRLNSPLTECIINHKGLLDKYIGDAIMAVFNAPVDVDNHADMACEAALEMIDILYNVNKEFSSENLPEIDIGIGLNTGVATVGNIGSKLRFDYTAIGDSVNLASRLEGLNKLYKTNIILSEFTKNKLFKSFLLKKIDKVRVKGRSTPVEIYELMRMTDKNRYIADRFNIAIESYFEGDFAYALKEFEKIGFEYEDKTAFVYIDRCRELLDYSPVDGWDGVFTAKTK